MKRAAFLLLWVFFLFFFSCGTPVKDHEKLNVNSERLADFGLKLEKELLGHTRYVYCLDFSPNQEYLASGSADETIRIWDTRSGKEKRTIEESYKELWGIPVRFSPDGNYLAAGVYEKLKLYDAQSNFNERASCDAHKRGIQSVSISPDNKYVISAGADGEIKIWSIPDLKLVSSRMAHSSEVWSVSVSPKGDFLISGGEDGSFKVWKIPSLELFKDVKFHILPIEYVRYSKSGNLFLVASADATVSVWKKGEYNGPYRLLKGQLGGVLTADFSPDERFVFSGGEDDTIYVYELKTAEVIYRLKEHYGDVMSVVVSPDGSFLASGSRDRSIKFWKLSF